MGGQNDTEWGDMEWRSGQILLAVLLPFLAVFLSLATICGNLLVMVSFKVDSSLQNVSNLLLVSLSVADFTIGAVSMPLFSTYLLLGSWPFGSFACDLWLSIDYTVSNASVASLLLITFDRYFSVTRPLSYRVNRTTRKALICIAVSWLVSSLIWTPWIFLWPYLEGERSIPEGKCFIQFLVSSRVITILTAVVAFFLPVSIMAGIFVRIFLETKKRAVKLGKLQQGAPSNDKTTDSQASDRKEIKSKTATITAAASSTIVQTTTTITTTTATTSTTTATIFTTTTAKNELVSCTNYMASCVKEASPEVHVIELKDVREVQMETSFGNENPDMKDKSVKNSVGGNEKKEDVSRVGVDDDARLNEKMTDCIDEDSVSVDTKANKEVRNVIENGDVNEGFLTRGGDVNANIDRRHVALAAVSENAVSMIHRERPQLVMPGDAEDKSCGRSGTRQIGVGREGGVAVIVVGGMGERENKEMSVHEGGRVDGENRIITGKLRASRSEPIFQSFISDKSNINSCVFKDEDDTTDGESNEKTTNVNNETSKVDTKAPVRNKKLDDDGDVHTSSQNFRRYSYPHTTLCKSPFFTPLSTATPFIHATPLLDVVPVRRQPPLSLDQIVLQARAAIRLVNAVKSRRARKLLEKKMEGKAAKTLSVVFFLFVLTWAPYNIFTVVQVLCAGCIPETLYNLGYWLCYLNSTFNPLCYALCNTAFRRTYRKVVTCQVSQRSKTQANGSGKTCQQNFSVSGSKVGCQVGGDFISFRRTASHNGKGTGR